MKKTNIYQKLLVIQKAVKGLKKDKKGNNYDYVTGNKLLSFVKPLMDEQSLILKQEVLSIDNQRMDYHTGVGTQYEKPKSEILSKVMMRFTWVDCETGEMDENLFGANGQNEWEKGLGSALTYAERYFILKYFHIATDEDDIDNPDRKPEKTETKDAEPKQYANAEPKKIPAPKRLTPEQVKLIPTSEELKSLLVVLANYTLTTEEKSMIDKRINELKK
jgi:hypothetical protein